MKPLAILLALSSIANFKSVCAYEQQTHRALTRAALQNSILGDQLDPSAAEARARLGVRPYDQEKILYRNSKGTTKRTTGLLVEDGVDFEDDGMRALNHFFDPRTRVGLGVYGASSSIDWALGTYGDFHYPLQSRSYADLKRYYFQALTGDIGQRKLSLTLMYETLGHVIHHIQDAAQPQHTRNDPHLSSGELDSTCDYVTPALVQLFALCRFYLANRNPSFYEKWTLELENSFLRKLPKTGYAPVFGAPMPPFPATPREFFVNEGRGIAEYSSSNFLTAGTITRSPPELGEPYEMATGTLCSGAVPPCGAIDPSLKVWFWPSIVHDQLRSESSPHPFSASWSILTPDFKTYAVAGTAAPMTVNRFTFEYNYAFLLPRAVGYSAGFINYFFRGNIALSTPAEGVLAAIDVSPSSCAGECGFKRVRITARNRTPNESIGSGTLYLVANFRVNQCFRGDLSGDDGGPKFHSEACRSLDPMSIVSKELPVQGIPSDKDVVLTFDFQSATIGIPINASDLSIQVVFRGQLGMESDAIVVSTLDVSEPNYVAVGNMTDYVFYDGDNRFSPLKPGDYPITLDKVTFSFQDPASQAPPLATITSLAAGQHAQFAFITTKGARNMWQQTDSWPPYPFDDDVPFRVDEFFKDDDDDKSVYARTCKLVLERGRYRQYSTYYGQAAHGRFTDATSVPVASALSPVGQRRLSKAAGQCYGPVTPGSNGPGDYSYLAPFTNANAKAWTINFP